MNVIITNIYTDLYTNLITDEYYEKIFSLLSQLTDAPIIDKKHFINIITSLDKNQNILVYKIDDIPVGMVTIIIEKKLIHGGKSVAHIEDLVVDSNYRGRGIASKLLKYVINIAKNKKCYKIILNCNSGKHLSKLTKFYTLNGFHRSGIMMKYLL